MLAGATFGGTKRHLERPNCRVVTLMAGREGTNTHISSATPGYAAASAGLHLGSAAVQES